MVGGRPLIFPMYMLFALTTDYSLHSKLHCRPRTNLISHVSHILHISRISKIMWFIKTVKHLVILCTSITSIYGYYVTQNVEIEFP